MSPRKPPASSFDEPSLVKALAHPMRVSILARLQERRATPRELAQWLGVSLGAISYHVRTLHKLGMIELVATTQVRGAIAHHYRAKERPRFSDESWAAASPVVKQAAVAATLATMSEYAHASADAGGFERDEARLHRGRLRLDAKGWEAASEACGKARPPDRRDRARRRAAPEEDPTRRRRPYGRDHAVRGAARARVPQRPQALTPP